MKFDSEAQLFKTAWQSKFIQRWLYEDDCFVYHEIEARNLSGIPDLLIAQVLHGQDQLSVRRSIAFEMKLSNWKRALQQAFRYKAYTDLVYVVMDNYHVHRAIKHIENFQKSGVGLASIDRHGNMTIHAHSRLEDPYCTYLSNKLRQRVIQVISDDLATRQSLRGKDGESGAGRGPDALV